MDCLSFDFIGLLLKNKFRMDKVTYMIASNSSLTSRFEETPILFLNNRLG